MKAQHTPGPWRERQYGGNWDILSGDRFPHERTVATVYMLDDTDRANARLIAAAPDLLAALEALAATARTFRNVPKSRQQWTYTDDGALELAFAAIRKARGEGE